MIQHHGIDVAKLNHFASRISSDGEILVGPFQFSNDGNDFHYLVSAFEPFDDEESIIGPESTAYYIDNQIRYLVAEDYHVVSSIHSLLLSCGKITSIKQRRIRSALTSSPRLL